VSDDLVTEEMVGDAFCAWHGARGTDAERIDAALRAVAPMIAGRAQLSSRIEPAVQQLVREEREACAKIADQYKEAIELDGHAWTEGFLVACESIAAAIRARGEPTT
jgi:hypothetical protein